jgi:hypothetical protein
MKSRIEVAFEEMLGLAVLAHPEVEPQTLRVFGTAMLTIFADVIVKAENAKAIEVEMDGVMNISQKAMEIVMEQMLSTVSTKPTDGDTTCH